MTTFFKSPFWILFQIVLCLIFTLLELHRNSLCIHCIVVVVSLRISKTWAKNIVFLKFCSTKKKILIIFIAFLVKSVHSGPILAVYCVWQSQAITCPFLKYFQILNIFAQIYKYFALFHPFSEKSHACSYFLEKALTFDYTHCHFHLFK